MIRETFMSCELMRKSPKRERLGPPELVDGLRSQWVQKQRGVQYWTFWAAEDRR